MPKVLHIVEADVILVQSLVKAKTHMEKAAKHLRYAGIEDAANRAQSILDEDIIPVIEAFQ